MHMAFAESNLLEDSDRTYRLAQRIESQHVEQFNTLFHATVFVHLKQITSILLSERD